MESEAVNGADFHRSCAIEAAKMSSNETNTSTTFNLPVEYENKTYTQSLAAGPGSIRESPASAFEPELLLVAWKQWWKFALPLGLVLGTGIAAAVWWLYVPSYQASALIQIEDKPPFVAFPNSNPVQSGRYVQTQLELIRSPIILGTVLSRPDIAGIEEIRSETNPAETLANGLGISQVNKSDLFRVSYQSPSPTNSAAIANAIVDEYLALQQEEEIRLTEAVITVLADEGKQRQAIVERLRKQLIELAKDVTGKDPFGHGLVFSPEKASPLAVSLYRELADLEFKIEMAEGELAASTDATFAGHLSVLVEDQVSKHPSVLQKEAEVRTTQSRMAKVEAVARHPYGNQDYRMLQAELQARSVELKALRDDLASQYRRLAQRNAQEARRGQIVSLQGQLETLQKRREWLKDQLNQQLADVQQAGETGLELEFVNLQLEQEARVLDLISRRELELKTELSAPPRVRLRQAAHIPSEPLEAIPYKQMAVGSGVGFFLPFALAILWEVRQKRIATAAHLRRESNLRILGEIARLPVRPVAARSLHSLPRNVHNRIYLYLQSLDNLRMNLLLSDDLQAAQVFAVVSAASREGKTTVATGLGTSLGRLGQGRSLIIDADLRAPDIASALGIPSGPGLADVLEGTCSLSDAIQCVDNTDTYALPAGKARINAQDLVRSDTMRKLLDELRTQFRFIVIDTAPCLAAAESLVFAKLSDAVVLSALCDVSIARQVRIVSDRLEGVGANLVGAVLSGVPTRSYTSRYGTYGHSTLIASN